MLLGNRISTIQGHGFEYSDKGSRCRILFFRGYWLLRFWCADRGHRACYFRFSIWRPFLGRHIRPEEKTITTLNKPNTLSN